MKKDLNEEKIDKYKQKEKVEEKEEVDDLYWNELVRNDCQINDISHSF